MQKSYESKKLRLGLFIILFAMPFSRANEINIPGLDCNISLSKNKIVYGEPVYINFSFNNTAEGEFSLSLWDSYDRWDGDVSNRPQTEDLKILVQDCEGNDIPRRNLLCRPASQSVFFSEHVESGKTVTGEYPLHLRISTCLKPGKYSVIINAFSLSHCYMSAEKIKSIGSGVQVWELETEIFSGPSLELEVEPRNEEKLVVEYDAIMQKAKAFIIGRWRGDEYYDLIKPVWTILWAEGPAAVPYQIELIYDSERGFRYWPPAIVNTWDNIVRYATPSQVEQILEMARHPECYRTPGEEYSKYYTPGLAWAIHHWHKNRSEEVKERTRELAEKLPNEDPCPRSMELGQSPYGK